MIRLHRLYKKLKRTFLFTPLQSLSALIPLLIFLFYVIPVLTKSILGYRAYGYAGYDAGIYYHAIYKLSRFQGFFNTIRGTWFFGNHATYIAFLVTPFFWISNSLSTLLVFQALSLGGSILVLWHICEHYKLGLVQKVAVCSAWALNPAIVNTNLENFHPDTLGVIWVLLGWNFWIRGKKTGFWISMTIALLCKEDYPVVLFFLGPLLFFKEKKRKEGFVFSLLCVSWYLLYSKIVWPLGNGIMPFSSELPEIPSHWFTTFMANTLNPVYYYETIVQAAKLHYVFQLLFPLAFLSIVGWEFFFIALVPILINILGNVSYHSSIYYHYNNLSSVFLFLALILAFKRITWRKTGNVFAGIVLCCSLIANVNWSRLPIGKQWSILTKSYQHVRDSEIIIERNQILEQTPPEMNVAVSSFLGAKFCARKICTIFPNPWIGHYWGQWFQENRFLLSPKVIDRIILDRPSITNNEAETWLLSQLMQSKYFTYHEQYHHTLVLDRVPVENNPHGFNVWVGDQKTLHHGLSYLINNYRITNYLGEELEFDQTITLKGFLYCKPGMELRVPSDVELMLDCTFKLENGIVTPQIARDGLFGFSVNMVIHRHRKRFIALEFTQNNDTWGVFPETWIFPENTPEMLTLARAYNQVVESPFLQIGNPTIHISDKTPSVATWKQSSWESEKGCSEWQFEDGVFFMQNTKPADQKIVKLIPIEPGQVLKFEAEIRTENVIGESGAFICILGEYRDSRMIRDTQNWQLVELVIVNTTAERKEIPFCLRLGHYGKTVTGKAWFRKVSAYPVKIHQWQDVDMIYYLE
jgi:uncharacterized membrane protein